MDTIPKFDRESIHFTELSVLLPLTSGNNYVCENTQKLLLRLTVYNFLTIKPFSR